MKISRTFLGALVGSFIGLGLLVLSIYLASAVDISWLWLITGGISWLIAGIVAGVIATTPKKGIMAGLLTALFNFILSSILVVILAFVSGATLGYLFATIISLGTIEDPSSMGTALGLIVAGVGLLINLIISALSIGFYALAGFLGGSINNPNRSQKEAYQDYPE
jgi:hypothetical protein